MIEDGRPVFRFLLFAWSVTKAKEARAGSEPDYHVELARIVEQIALGNEQPQVDEAGRVYLKMGLVQIDPVHAMTASLDLAEPLYSVTIPLPDCGGIVIDGWERAYRAMQQGMTTYPVYHFRGEAERAIRLEPPDDLLAHLASQNETLPSPERR